MKTDKMNGSNIFYTNIVFGKSQIEKIVIAKDEDDVKEIIDDNFHEFTFYHSISLEKLNNFLIQIKENPNKKFAMVYEFKNYEQDFEVIEEVMFLEDLDKFKAEAIAQDKSIIILDENFIEKAYMQILLMSSGESKPLISSNIEI